MTDEKVASPSDLQMELARTRTLLAMERTLLAWIRTSLSLIAFGFTMSRFIHVLIGAGALRLPLSHFPRYVGIMLVILGILGLACGIFDHFRSVKRLQQNHSISPWSASVIMAVILAAIGLLLMIDILMNLAT